MNDEKDKDIIELEKLAEEIVEMKKKFKQRRPIVIEFCGSPKSGKSSCIHALNVFLKHYKFKTGIITEQASICPIKDKDNPTFNIWTIHEAINKLNALLDKKRNEHLDVVICDRAIFDGLCWFKWMLDQKNLEENEYKAIKDYITLPRWSNKIDLVYIFTANPAISIERKYKHYLSRKSGNIMNNKTLAQYNDCIKYVKEKFKDNFRSIEEIDTNELTSFEVNKKVAQTILNKLKELLIEKIGYVEKSELKKIGFDVQNTEVQKWNENLPISLDMVKFDWREDVEKNNELLQLIAIGVLTNKERNKILILKKRPASSKNSAEEGSHVVWFGGHMRAEDKNGGFSKIGELIRATLKRETKEEIDILVSINEVQPHYIYSTAYDKSKNHLAICFLIEKELDDLKLSIDSHELILNKGTSRSGTFMSLDEIRNSKDLFAEEWSQLILSKLFDIHGPWSAPLTPDKHPLFFDNFSSDEK